MKLGEVFMIYKIAADSSANTYEFSGIFHYFIKRIFEIGVPIKTDTCSIHEYNDLFVNRLQAVQQMIC